MPANSFKADETPVGGVREETAYETLKGEDVVKAEEYKGDGKDCRDGKWAVIQSMISQIRNGTPIYRIHLPIFLQEPRSLLERYSDFCTHMDIFTSVADIQDPEQRFLQVVKFYLSGWHARPKELRNPFNPILGETFRCFYQHNDSTTQYVAEQISHHPPSSAFCVLNDAKGMYLTAYVRPSSKFKGNSLDTTLQGRLAGHCRRYKEDYELTFPHFVVKGLVLGSLHLTLSGPAKLVCPQSGYSAEMDFRPSSGFFSGQPNYVCAKVKKIGHSKTLYTIEGKWDELLKITSRSGDSGILFDVSTTPRLPAKVPALEDQAENESRKVWQKVVQNIQQNNEPEALREKTVVEERQRALERDRKGEWAPNLFCKVDEDYYVHKSLLTVSPIFNPRLRK